MKKSTGIVIAVLAVLTAGAAILAALNGAQATAKKKLQNDAEFLIVTGEGKQKVTHKVTMEELQALEPQAIEAVYKKSGKDPETRAFTGVPFAAVLRAKNIDPTGFKTAAFTASDGYASALPIADALNEESCFIVIDSGDEGPFRMILAKDQFSQRWCKLLTDVTLT